MEKDNVVSITKPREEDKKKWDKKCRHLVKKVMEDDSSNIDSVGICVIYEGGEKIRSAWRLRRQAALVGGLKMLTDDVSDYDAGDIYPISVEED